MTAEPQLQSTVLEKVSYFDLDVIYISSMCQVGMMNDAVPGSTVKSGHKKIHLRSQFN